MNGKTDLWGNIHKTKSIGGHERPVMKNEEWLTPPYIIEAVGPFDLDPCSPIERPWPTATHHYTIQDNGLKCEWFGNVWLNPPYGKLAALWMKKMVHHGSGVALLFARTETRLFVDNVWNEADSMLFLYGRLHFHHVDGRRATANSGAPSVLIAYGSVASNRLKACGLPGKFIDLNPQAPRPMLP